MAGDHAVDDMAVRQQTGEMGSRRAIADKRRWVLHALIYGALLAAGAFLLEWFDYKHRAMHWSTSVYVLFVAVGFACLGGWIGYRLTADRSTGRPEVNHAAIVALGLSDRELEVLALLAEGCANKLIARRLNVSPNTVKTHVSRLYGKLEVTSRTQAVARAREMAILA